MSNDKLLVATARLISWPLVQFFPSDRTPCDRNACANSHPLFQLLRRAASLRTREVRLNALVGVKRNRGASVKI